MQKNLIKKVFALCVLNAATHGVEMTALPPHISSQEYNFGGIYTELSELSGKLSKIKDPKLATILYNSHSRSYYIMLNMRNTTHAVGSFLSADGIPTQWRSVARSNYPEQESRDQKSLDAFRIKLNEMFPTRAPEPDNTLQHTKFQIQCQLDDRLMAYSMRKITDYLEQGKHFVDFIENTILKRNVSEIERSVFNLEVLAINHVRKFAEIYEICEPDSRHNGALTTPDDKQEDEENRRTRHKQLEEQESWFSPPQLRQLETYYRQRNNPQHQPEMNQ